MTADCRDDKYIGKQGYCYIAYYKEGYKDIGKYAGHEVIICTYLGKNPTIQFILLPYLCMLSLAAFIPELY